MRKLSASRHAIDPPTVESGCSGFTCDVNTLLLLVVVVGALALGAVALLSCVRRARESCEFERERLVAEYEAFLEFADRVLDVQVAPRPDGGRLMGDTFVGASQKDRSMERVEEAYRETVMDVPHFDDDYDESLKEHMAADLGPELAAAVADGRPLTPSVQKTIVASAQTAAEDRKVLIDQLEEELSDLDDAEGQLRSISNRFQRTDGEGLVHRTFPELETRWRRLEALEGDCADLLEERQGQLRDRAPDRGTRLQSPTAVSGYLYGDLDVDFPVLSAGTRLLDRVREEKRHTLRALTRRRQ